MPVPSFRRKRPRAAALEGERQVDHEARVGERDQRRERQRVGAAAAHEVARAAVRRRWPIRS